MREVQTVRAVRMVKSEVAIIVLITPFFENYHDFDVLQFNKYRL
jgi:hypothetical protein